MTFGYFSSLGQCCFRPMSMAALLAQATVDACLAGHEQSRFFFLTHLKGSAYCSLKISYIIVGPHDFFDV